MLSKNQPSLIHYKYIYHLWSSYSGTFNHSLCNDWFLDNNEKWYYRNRYLHHLIFDVFVPLLSIRVLSPRTTNSFQLNYLSQYFVKTDCLMIMVVLVAVHWHVLTGLLEIIVMMIGHNIVTALIRHLEKSRTIAA